MATTQNARDIHFFSQRAKSWWDAKGPMGALHALNETRLSFIKDKVCQKFNCDGEAPAPYQGLTFLDVGSGAGLVSESLCRLGGRVTALDASPEVCEAARVHAEAQGLDITYEPKAIEDFQETGFDVVVALEVIEHVKNWPFFLECLSKKLNPNGLLILSTLNRTALSYVLGIVMAENILKWVPKGAHDWHSFLKPSEIEGVLRKEGLRTISLKGFSYHPLAKRWDLSDNLKVNYILAAEMRKKDCK